MLVTLVEQYLVGIDVEHGLERKHTACTVKLEFHGADTDIGD